MFRFLRSPWLFVAALAATLYVVATRRAWTVDPHSVAGPIVELSPATSTPVSAPDAPPLGVDR